MAPRISVVIASYNHGAFIGAAIESILNQSFEDFEIVIVDDCSTDKSADVIRGFKDPRIILHVLAQNSGPSIAMNECIRRSSGEFIANLGSDDFFLPGKLAKQIAYLDSNPGIAAVFGMPRFVDESGAAMEGGAREFTFPFSHPQPSRHEWLRHFFFRSNCLCHPAILIRKSVHDELGGYDPRLMALADLDMWTRTCMVHEIHVIQEEMTGRRLLSGNRNLSAPRRDTILRDAFERSQIANHYRGLSAEEFEIIFGQDARKAKLDPNLPPWLKLARLAFLTAVPPLHLFGLMTMFEAENKTDQQYREVIEAAGHVDVFGLGERMELQRLRRQTLNSLPGGKRPGN